MSMCYLNVSWISTTKSPTRRTRRRGLTQAAKSPASKRDIFNNFFNACTWSNTCLTHTCTILVKDPCDGAHTNTLNSCDVEILQRYNIHRLFFYISALSVSLILSFTTYIFPAHPNQALAGLYVPTWSLPFDKFSGLVLIQIWLAAKAEDILPSLSFSRLVRRWVGGYSEQLEKSL